MTDSVILNVFLTFPFLDVFVSSFAILKLTVYICTIYLYNMYICIYIYIYIYIYIHTHTHTHLYIYTHTHTHTQHTQYPKKVESLEVTWICQKFFKKSISDKSYKIPKDLFPDFISLILSGVAKVWSRLHRFFLITLYFWFQNLIVSKALQNTII